MPSFLLRRLTPKGKQFADLVLNEIHAAEERAMQETLEHFSPEFVDALEFYANTFHNILTRRNSDNEK